MSIKNNPFFILGVECTSNRRAIISAAEEMGFSLDASVCTEAQNALLNPAKRLLAELDWFVDASPDQIRYIREKISNDLSISANGLKPLSKLNATLYNFEKSRASDSFELGFSLLEIDELYSKISPEVLANSINERRLSAGFVVANEQDVIAGLNKKRENIRRIITEKLDALSDDDYIDLVTKLAEKNIANTSYSDGAVISDVIDQYEIRMQSQLESMSADIENQIDGIKSSEASSAINARIERLVKTIKAWDRIAQPLQLKSQASGIPHDNSQQVGRDVRELAVYLHNEKNESQTALELVQAMRPVFAEMDELTSLFESDSDTLESIIDSNKEAQDVIKEFDSIIDAGKKLVSYANKETVDHFIASVRELDSRIKALNLDKGTTEKLRVNLCMAARGAAIQLHNEKGQTELALSIISALMFEFEGLEGDFMERAKASGKTRYGYDDLPLHSKLFTDHMTLSREIENKKSKKTGCLVRLCIVGVIGLVLLIVSLWGEISSSCKGSSKSGSTYTARPTAVATQKATPIPTATPQPTVAPSPTPAAVPVFNVSFAKEGGSGGTTSVRVKLGDAMPSANAPTREGYDFKGYYSEKNGKGTKYYDSNMNSKHNWDQETNAKIYAYWSEKKETRYGSDSAIGDPVYTYIVSIFPTYGIYTEGQTHYTHFVCKCKTSADNTLWLYISVSDYKKYFDSSASSSIYNDGYKTKTFSKKTIHGVVVKADDVLYGLSDDIGKNKVIQFSSVG